MDRVAFSRLGIDMALVGVVSEDGAGAGALVAALVTALDEGPRPGGGRSLGGRRGLPRVEHGGGRPPLTIETVRGRAERRSGRPVGSA